MRLTLVRHATLLLELGGRRLLVDPMLDDAEARPAVQGTANDRRNPLVPLPLPAEEVVEGIDAVLVTHLHADHFDEGAARALPAGVPVLAQPEDVERLTAHGLRDVRPVQDELAFDGLTVVRTPAEHGRGEILRMMGPVSGFVVRHETGTVYVAGDTIWCPAVAETLERERPDLTVLNAGAAQFLQGGAITMEVEDVVQVARALPATQLVAVHMEAINHCLLTRDALREGLAAAGVSASIPADGARVEPPARVG